MFFLKWAHQLFLAIDSWMKLIDKNRVQLIKWCEEENIALDSAFNSTWKLDAKLKGRGMWKENIL